jgi:hypothetical protein
MQHDEFLGQGQLAKVRDQLPAEFNSLFTGSTGQLRS